MFELHWDLSTNKLFSYGSKIDYIKEKQEVHFQNILCSPGETIIQWNSKISFFSKNKGMQLPLLIRGQKYQLFPNIIATPKDSILIKVSFFDRIDQIVGSTIINENCKYFTYPLDAYSYSVELVNLQVKDLIFNKIVINNYKNKS